MTDNDTPQDWEQVKILVSQAQASQAETLLRGILSGSLAVETDYEDLFPDQVEAYRGPVSLIGYYPSKQRGKIRKRIQLALERGGIAATPQFSRLPRENWATAWQKRYRPIPLGKNLVIVPTWLENPYPERLPILMDPGMAFGSGTHPTTQLCLVLLEKWTGELIPGSMIDLGCGSGILSIAAAKLGVPRVLGLDPDPDAVRISAENADVNQVGPTVVFRQGSVKEALESRGDFPGAVLVAANIIAPILDQLFKEGLADLVPPGGKLILSGILEEQAPGMLDWLAGTGFSVLEQRQQGEWVGIVGQKG